MPDINITVAHKVAVSDTQSIVCDNSDYMVNWTLDEEWSAYDTKTMRAIYMDGTFTDKVFAGDTIALPVCTVPGVVQIGLFAGDIRTSRVAILRALPSVRSAAGAPADPTPDVYDQLMERMAQLENPDWAQNDPSAKDYVENRTHYVSQENRVIVPEQEVTTAVQDDLNVAILNSFDSDALKPLLSSEDDTTFDVVFDEASYPCKWLEHSGNRIPVFGNLAIFDPSSTDTGEPFAFSVGQVENDIAIAIACKVAGTHTVAVSYQQDVVHTLDPKYIGRIDPASFANVDSDNDTFSIPFTKEFAAGKWAQDYSYFEDEWLNNNFGADISLEINGKLFEHLPFSTGSVGAFTYGNLDTIGVAIVNGGYGTRTQRVKVSAALFPDGVKGARVFRSGVYTISEGTLPPSARWVTEYDPEKILTKTDGDLINRLSYIMGDRIVSGYLQFEQPKQMLVVDNNGTLTPEVTVITSSKKQIDTTMVLNNGGTVTQDMIPSKVALVGLTRNNEVVLLNPEL